MKTVTVTIPTSPDELAEQRRLAAEAEVKRQRENLVKRNRAAGKPEPKVGGSLFVATARGLKVRGRAGLMFSPQVAEVKIIDATDEEIVAQQRQGTYVTNAYGAELILEDSPAKPQVDENGKAKPIDPTFVEHTGLIVFGSKTEGAASSAADLSDEALEAEVARRKAVRADSPERLGHSSRKATKSES